jgi:hypothetical protein
VLAVLLVSAVSVVIVVVIMAMVAVLVTVTATVSATPCTIGSSAARTSARIGPRTVTARTSASTSSTSGTSPTTKSSQSSGSDVDLGEEIHLHITVSFFAFRAGHRRRIRRCLRTINPLLRRPRRQRTKDQECRNCDYGLPHCSKLPR